MSALRSAEGVRELLERRLAQRHEVGARYYAAEGDRIARVCHRMAERFARGGRLLAFGLSPAARSDVRHVAVEFVHPVIVGKRALPALGLVGESSRVSREL
jgi:D-sedoheptulose 7-phosphate isomerase